MIKYKDPMLDSDFLTQLTMEKEREIYAKVVALDIDENPIEEIQGRVTQGSVPVDGNSIVRRTCSLTMVAHEMNINDYIWGLETKIKLFIGLRNKLNSNYPPIIWFKMGTFVLTSFSNSISSSGHTISLQGKDKMCLLNGDVGGTLTALSYDFGTVKVINKSGYSYTEQIPIKQIIKSAVHEYANEPFHNIILNDLDDCGLELIEYRGDSPLYFVYSPATQEVSNMVLNQQQKYYIKGIGELSLEEIERQNAEDIAADMAPRFVFKTLTEDMDLTVEQTPTEFYGGADEKGNRQGPYNLIKITKGMTCGYRTCELVYAGKLTASAGEAITSILTKIVNMLGNYEYFYNLDGQFVFQRKRTYVNTSWNNMVNNGEENWVENAAYTSSYTFSFEDGTLITSYQNAPNLANLKNDFSIWGTRSGVNGAQIPVHLRYAIDNKPTYYTSFDRVTYTTKTEEEVEWDKKYADYDLPATGYKKEPSRFGLSEDWWEVRDWAKAWIFSGYPEPPSEWLGKYCPIKAYVYNSKYDPPSLSGNNELVPIEDRYWQQWNIADDRVIRTDDIIFKPDGTYWSSHGSCAHSYTEWLNYFAEGGWYEGGYAYFYKPQVPADENINGGEGLLLGDQIKYSCDWRELIYRMAIDYKKHADKDPNPNDENDINRDNFLMKVKELNPSFYPNGYTGYEQYYTDMEAFWRQLYDPDYTTSYDVISLSQRRYTEEGKLGGFFYDAPIYSQCNEEDPFFSETMYYLLQDGEYVAQTGLLQTEYGKNPTQYYRITDTKIQPVPLIKEPYTSKPNSYWKRTGNGYQKATNVTYQKYSSLAMDLYLRISEYSYFPCVTIKPFVAGKLYFEKVENGEDFKPVPTLKEDLYLARPGYYYERVIVGGQIKFSNCTVVQPYDSEREYFKRVTAVDGSYVYQKVDPKILIEEAYNNEGFNNPYYYAVINYSYIPCVHPKNDYDPNCTYYVEGLKEYELDPESPNLYWNKQVQNSPESLNFWFDFLDTYGELSQYSVANVGDRPKAVNDSNVKAIYFRETPGVIFVEDLNNIDEKKSGYTYAQLPQHLEYLFSISGQGKSAKDVLDNYLYTYSYCTESITINAIPVYHLEPNTRIFVRDDRCGINGEYIVTKINYPLDASGTMSINATKVVDRIY